jgi:hypothetical protein
MDDSGIVPKKCNGSVTIPSPTAMKTAGENNYWSLQIVKKKSFFLFL